MTTDPLPPHLRDYITDILTAEDLRALTLLVETHVYPYKSMRLATAAQKSSGSRRLSSATKAAIIGYDSLWCGRRRARR
jgi:hypothetical protein